MISRVSPIFNIPMSDIYEQIWHLSSSHVSVSRRDEQGAWIDPDADILLDEQAPTDGCTSAEAAPRPLIAQVNPNVLAQPSFKALIALLDNYNAQEGQPELKPSDPKIKPEIEAFLDAVFATEAMQLAADYAQTSLSLDADQFRAKVEKMWFEPFTNRFSGSEDYCVGFEHIFVGEDSSGGQAPKRCQDSIGGYHSWVKYYLDQSAGTATYLGHDYEAPVAQAGLAEPHVATVIMTWQPTAAAGGAGYELLKRPGGFFVGTRPECELAIASLGLLEMLADQFENQGKTSHRRVKFGQSSYDLVVYPQTVNRQSGQYGEHLRSFYPKFRGSEAGVVVPQPDRPISIPTQPQNNGPIRIVRALPNPVGTADQGEWVELQNVSGEAIDLSDWHLADNKGRKQLLSGTLGDKETQQIMISRLDATAMQLSNSGGWILLFENGQRRAAVQYGKAQQDEIFEFI